MNGCIKRLKKVNVNRIQRGAQSPLRRWCELPFISWCKRTWVGSIQPVPLAHSLVASGVLFGAWLKASLFGLCVFALILSSCDTSEIAGWPLLACYFYHTGIKCNWMSTSKKKNKKLHWHLYYKGSRCWMQWTNTGDMKNNIKLR